MHKRLLLLCCISSHLCFSQNVGIGTSTPETPLHIKVAAATAILRLETNAPNSQSGMEFKTSTTPYDRLEIRKFTTAASGTIAGISLDGLSMVTAGAAAQGGLLLGTIPNYPLYFTTNNIERMRILANGDFGIGTTAPDYKFHINASGEAGLGLQNNVAAGQSILALGFGARAGGNSLTLLKFGSGVAGNAFGMPKANQSIISSDYGSSSLVVGTSNNSSLYFGVNSVVKMEIRPDGNTGVDVPANNSAKFHVRRPITHYLAAPVVAGAIYGENGSDIDGSGLYGATLAPRSSFFYAGVTGNNPNTGTDRYGVIGQSGGTSSGGVYSAGVGGYGDYGVIGYSQSATGAGVMAQHESGKTALEVNNGFIKVSGSNKTAFKHTTSATNITGNISRLNYASQSPDDIVIITHNYSPTNTYMTKAVGVYWTGSSWSIYTEDLSNMPQNITFNVLVIKQ